MSRFHRILMIAALFSVCGVLLAAEIRTPPAFDGGGVAGLNLKTQLEKGLKARRPVEFEYIRQIVDLVEEGELPYHLVITTFGWAQMKPNRQLQWFQLALAARTRNLDIDMPNLNLQAVGTSQSGGFHGVNTPPIPAK